MGVCRGTLSDKGDLTTNEVDGNEEKDGLGGIGEDILGDSLDSICKNSTILKANGGANIYIFFLKKRVIHFLCKITIVTCSILASIDAFLEID